MGSQTTVGVLAGAALLLVLLAPGCSTSPQSDATVREHAADATAKLKQDGKEAGREIEKGAAIAAEKTHAVAEGVKEGWDRGAAPGTAAPLDVNTATASQLSGLPGVTRGKAEEIVRNRPYRSTRDLVARGVLTRSEYDAVRDRITAR